MLGTPLARLFATALLASLLAPALALAEVPAPSAPLPLPRGPRFSVRIDSSPQTAAIYVNDKLYGIQGYTPSTLKLPRGAYRILLDLPNFKPAAVNIEVTRSQAFAVTLERAPRPALLDLRAAADGNALGASIIVDGTAVGTLPNRVEVGAGNHVVEVVRPGFVPYRENTVVVEGETRTVVVPLAAQVRPGSLLVTADAPNAMVYVDGAQKDSAPTVILDLPEGAHTVEVRAGGLTPWKQVVVVAAGQQTKVAAQLLAAAPAVASAGSLRVLSATPNADVLLDGEGKGPAGIEIKAVAPGSHIVEVRAVGFAPQRVPVDIVAGQVKTIQVDLLGGRDPGAGSAGLHVISAIPDVEVFVDGASVGKSPVTRRDLAAGKHFVVARRPGFADFKLEVDLAAGQTQEVLADLRASGALRVLSTPAGATVLLDGASVGVTPLSLADVPVGPHLVEFKLKDYVDGKNQVTVEGGQQGIVQADLVLAQKGPSVTELETTQRGMSSWGALVLDRGRFTLDAGTGYPYYLFARLQVGIWKTANLGLDLGVELRTFFVDTQVGLRPRFQIIKIDPFALGVDLTIMGGGGATNRNSFTFEIGPIITLSAGPFVHFNIKPYLGVWSDQLCPNLGDIQNDDSKTGTTTAGKPTPGSGKLYSGGERDVCKAYDATRSATSPTAYQLKGTTNKYDLGGQLDPRDRFTTVRFMLQASVEVGISKSISIFGMLEGAPLQNERQAFTGKFNLLFPDSDNPALYGRLGVTGKF